jgi:O-succinylbenzoate synthase
MNAEIYAMTFRRYSLPFRQPVRTAYGALARREGVMVRLSDERGATGLGEAAPIPWFGTETADEAAAACERLGARVSREQIDAIPERLGCLRFALASAQAECVAAGGGGADAGADLASGREGKTTLHDSGKFDAAGTADAARHKVAPHGGASGEADAFVTVAALLPAGRAALEAAARRAEAGFRTFKWKVGTADARDELALLDDVLAVLPAGARLRLDANGAWDRRTAERWLDRCADLSMVEFVEQPVAAARAEREADAGAQSKAMDLLLGLAGDFPVPLALDESVANSRDVTRWLDAGWPGLFVLKPSLIGDVAGTLERLRAAGCDAQSGRVVFSSALETAVGARAALGWALRWTEKNFRFSIFDSRLGAAAPDSQMERQPHQSGIESRESKIGIRRAAGFGVWPLFEDARFNGPEAAPFVHARDVRRLDGEAAWNALG